MRERPILFSGPMVRAILEGRKTVTRRVVKPQPTHFNPVGVPRRVVPEGGPSEVISCPYGAPGDRLWVREAWQALDGNERARRIMTEPNPSRGWIEYAATVPEGYEPPPRWRPSIHMPRWASRITLEIESVRVERLQDISEADAKAEGVLDWAAELARRPGVTASCIDRMALRYGSGSLAYGYAAMWDEIHGPGSWDANPWVWVVEFRRLDLSKPQSEIDTSAGCVDGSPESGHD